MILVSFFLFRWHKYWHIICIINLNINRVTNVTLDVTLYPELSNEEKTIMIAIKNNNKITREELNVQYAGIEHRFRLLF